MLFTLKQKRYALKIEQGDGPMNKDFKIHHEVWNEEELLEKMNERAFYILIKGDLNQKVKSLLKTTLSDEELMGSELGSAGTLSLLSEAIYQVLNKFSGKSKIERSLESKIRQYNFKFDNGNILLYLRQLDY